MGQKLPELINNNLHKVDWLGSEEEKQKALELSQDKEFMSQMEELFSGTPSGCIVFYDLSWAVSKIRELENEIKIIKEKLKGSI